MTDLLLEASGLRKQFEKTAAVAGIDIRLRGGDLFGLVGPDGAGKTTTIRLLCGALQPDAGEVAICGIPMAAHPDQARENIGYLSQRFSLYEDLTVLENIRFFAEVRGLSATEWEPRAREILDFVGLAAYTERPAGKLSGGMKQKLGLASAMVHRPRLLLLDEPTGGVDPVTRQDFWQLIIRLVAREGVGVLVTTPYMDEATRCTWVGILSNGRLALEGAPSDLRKQLDDRIIEVRGRPLVAIRKAIAGMPGVEDVQAFGDRLHIRVGPRRSKAVITAIQKQARSVGWTEVEAKLVSPQLEDVFISMSAEEA
jgi:ABC-2 type transport system ATP-binding protein